mgnify:CR=1 FL=1
MLGVVEMRGSLQAVHNLYICILFDIRDIIYAIVRKIVNQGYGIVKQEKFRREMLALYESLQSSGSIFLISLGEVINCYSSTLSHCY